MIDSKTIQRAESPQSRRHSTQRVGTGKEDLRRLIPEDGHPHDVFSPEFEKMAFELMDQVREYRKTHPIQRNSNGGIGVKVSLKKIAPDRTSNQQDN